MWQKSSILAMVFVAVAAALVCLYAFGATGILIHDLHLQYPDLARIWEAMRGIASTHAPGTSNLVDADMLTTLLLVVGAVALLIVGGDFAFIMLSGTMAVFITLTLFQGELIRYLSLAALLFCIGMYGMVVSRNAVRVLMSIELMLNAVNINLVAMSHYIDPSLIRGQVFAIFILTVAAAEAAVGLAIVLAVYRNMSTVDMEKFNLLKW